MDQARPFRETEHWPARQRSAQPAKDVLLTAPYAHKLLAWEGIGLCVPQQWDIGAFNGDHLLGSFRVDSPQRPVVQVRWWSTGKLISLDRTVGEFLDKSAQEKPDVRIVK